MSLHFTKVFVNINSKVVQIEYIKLPNELGPNLKNSELVVIWTFFTFSNMNTPPVEAALISYPLKVVNVRS